MTLITGSTGLIGRSWLRFAKSRRPACRYIEVARRSETHPIDLSDPKGFVSLEPYRAEIKTIIHSAASIRFSMPLHEARRVNTEMTSNLLDFASRCPKLERFAHISTVYVAGTRPGELAEGPPPEVDGFVNTYQQSKYEAEQLALTAAERLPVAVFRLSSVICDNTDGVVSQMNYFHQLIRTIPRNQLETIPGDADALVDAVPADWCAAALDRLLFDDFRTGAVYHLCAGADRSIPAGEMLDVSYRHFPGSLRPRFVSPDEFRAYASSLNGTKAGLAKVLGQFLPQLWTRQTFAPGQIPAPHLSDYYENVVRNLV